MPVPTASAHNTERMRLGDKTVKPNATIPGTADATVSVWENDRIATGVWECTPGAFAASRDGFTEICTIISGSVTLQSEGAEDEWFGPGDLMVTPSGWVGTWVVHETLRKHYTIIND